MNNKNITDCLSEEKTIDKTVFQITRGFVQRRSPETAFIQYIKDSQAYETELRG